MPTPETSEDKASAQRTKWSEDRTILANERTFASQMRTGMACVGVAMGMIAVFRETEHPLIARSVAELFVAVAIMIFGTAARRGYLAQRRIDDHDTTSQSHRAMIVTASLLTLGAAATGVILWFL